jgi:two-component system NtrC family sensor kinase
MARQTGPQRTATDLNDLVEATLDMTAYGLRNADIALEQSLDPTLPRIEADPDQIVQILINLIVNAQHALERKEGARRLILRSTTDREHNRIVVEVEDNGPGVPPDDVGRIFEPFFTTKEVGQGTGLGLSVCKGMAEAHGGTLRHIETPGGGATFRLTLPLRAAAEDARGEAQPPARDSKGHVLIVDDEAEVAALLAECLEPLGLDCTIAADGEHALRNIAAAGRFDVIFCDVRMPGMDGISLFQRLERERPDLAERLIFLSGDVLHRDMARLREVARRPIVEKPFDPDLVRKLAIQTIAPGDRS